LQETSSSYTPELSLLSALLTKENYNAYFHLVDLNGLKDISRELWHIYQVLQTLHADVPGDLSINDINVAFYVRYPQADKAIYQGLFERIESSALSPDGAVSILRDIQKRQAALRLSEVAYKISNGTANIDAAKEYLDVLHGVETVKSDDLQPLNTDLELLLENVYQRPGLRWRLNCLNRSLGSLRAGDFGFIFARPESYSRDTEVLTPSGWITVDKVTTETLIAQVDKNLETSFVYPKAVHPHEQDYCYHIHDSLGRVDLLVTEGHAMVYEKDGKLLKERADTIKYYQGIKHHVAARTTSQSKALNPMERLAIAYQADGHTRNYKEYGYTFSFLKSRKIERLKEILKEAGVEYSTYQDGNRGHTGFYLKSPLPLIKDFSWVKLDEKSANWCQEFIEELSYWDATRRSDTRFKYDTTDKTSADIVQAVATLAGYNCLLSQFEDNRKETFRPIYSLSIRSNYQPIDGQSIIKRRVEFKDTTYCFEVESGMLLVRRNGAVAVCGNTGKTTFLASEVSGFLSQTEQSVVWLNNEEDGQKVLLRIYQAFFGCRLEQLLANVKRYKEEFDKATGGRLKFYDESSISKSQVERIVERENPRLIVYDQIDKITGFAADREDLRLGSIYQWARELAKKKHSVIAVCQASGQAENTKYLEMNHVANALTAKQAEADYIIGIGKIHDMGSEKVRYLNLPKNKLMQDSDSDPNLRHGKFEVLLEADVARYRDIVDYGKK